MQQAPSVAGNTTVSVCGVVMQVGGNGRQSRNGVTSTWKQLSRPGLAMWRWSGRAPPLWTLKTNTYLVMPPMGSSPLVRCPARSSFTVVNAAVAQSFRSRPTNMIIRFAHHCLHALSQTNVRYDSLSVLLSSTSRHTVDLPYYASNIQNVMIVTTTWVLHETPPIWHMRLQKTHTALSAFICIPFLHELGC